MEIIKSRENSVFKKIKKLNNKKYRDLYRLFVSEGLKTSEFNTNFEYIIISESKKDSYLQFSDRANTYVFSDNLYNEISSQKNPQGILFVVKYLENKLELNSLNGDIIVLDQVQDPGNLGTIIRLADAVGITSIILTHGCCDVYNEKVVRSSMGSLFNVNIKYCDSSELMVFLEKNHYNVLVTALVDDSISYEKMSIKNQNAIIFGNEGNGVSHELQKISHQKLIIPIYGKAESLNVAVAAGIFLYKFIEIKKAL